MKRIREETNEEIRSERLFGRSCRNTNNKLKEENATLIDHLENAKQLKIRL